MASITTGYVTTAYAPKATHRVIRKGGKLVTVKVQA